MRRLWLLLLPLSGLVLVALLCIDAVRAMRVAPNPQLPAELSGPFSIPSPYYQRGNVELPFKVEGILVQITPDKTGCDDNFDERSLRGAIAYATQPEALPQCSVRDQLRNCQRVGCLALVTTTKSPTSGLFMWYFKDFTSGDDLTTPMVSVGSGDGELLRAIMAEATRIGANVTVSIDSADSVNDNEWAAAYKSVEFVVFWQAPLCIWCMICIVSALRRYQFHKRASQVRVQYAHIPLWCLGLEIVANAERLIYFLVDPVYSRALLPGAIGRIMLSLSAPPTFASTLLIILYWKDAIKSSGLDQLHTSATAAVAIARTRRATPPRAPIRSKSRRSESRSSRPAPTMTVPTTRRSRTTRAQAEVCPRPPSPSPATPTRTSRRRRRPVAPPACQWRRTNDTASCRAASGSSSRCR
eukprot:TRINITY_DN67551_c0_g1_i1.p1 TRINITY_DN67551_c0_g1~~TRINITY_DN67551_c0_g1_i1.p1  ORF type:complete len:413 (-),score=136.46 TRINITY_DN67551_c0_g1_i1:599-1837(-)